MLSQAAVTQRTRWHLAALTVQVRLARLRLTLNADNPFRPRVPAGSPEGGEWTRENVGGDARIILVGGPDDRRYAWCWKRKRPEVGIPCESMSARPTRRCFNGCNKAFGGR